MGDMFRHQKDCNHKLIFDQYLEPWFIHYCQKCEQRVFSNRIEVDLKEKDLKCRKVTNLES